MAYQIFSTVVKAVRLRYAVLFVLLLVAVYWVGILPWMENWDSTAAEQQMVLPGDDLHPNSTVHNTMAVTINAPAGVVWQWLVQVGQDRGGFYTYTWLENIFGTNIHNANEIRPEWQQLNVGDAWRLVPPDYLGGAGEAMASPVLLIEPGRALVVEMFGAYLIVPVDEQTSRLIVRGESFPDNPAVKMAWEPLVFTLARRMLLGLKARAEGRPDAPAALMAIAQLAWAAAGMAVAGLFVSQRRRWLGLALPVAAALPALLTSRDFQAALAAFIATGIIVLGFLIYGRSWWGPILVIGSVVLLALLLAPEAYTAIGLAFGLLLVGAAGMEVAGRSRTALDAPSAFARPVR